MKAGTKVELPLWLGEMLAVAGGYVSRLTAHDEETDSCSLFVMTSVQFISFSASNRQPESTDTIYTADLKVQVTDNSNFVALNLAARPS